MKTFKMIQTPPRKIATRIFLAKRHKSNVFHRRVKRNALKSLNFKRVL